MANSPKVAKLLVSSVPLTLEVDGGALKLPLKLSWNMRTIMQVERKLRDLGDPVNILQALGAFFRDLDATRLAVGVWAAAQQDSPEYVGDEGLEIISSFLTPDNYGVAVVALKDAFLESLSKERRDAIKKAEKEELEGAEPKDPTPARTLVM